MNNDRRTKNFFKILISQLAVGSIMFVLGFFVLFYAQGYRFNFKKFEVIKTGILYLVSNQKAADTIIDGKKVSSKMPYSVNLLPGSYTVEVAKEGYKSWYTRASIQPEYVTDFKTITLFYDKIVPQELTDQKKIDLLFEPIDVLAVNAEKELIYNDYEIWVNDELVTRFSKPISRAIWYPDLVHIVYQQDNEIHVIEKGGQNDVLLVTMSTDSPTVFAIGSRGEELYYRDNGQYKVAKIR